MSDELAWMCDTSDPVTQEIAQRATGVFSLPSFGSRRAFHKKREGSRGEVVARFSGTWPS